MLDSYDGDVGLGCDGPDVCRTRAAVLDRDLHLGDQCNDVLACQH